MVKKKSNTKRNVTIFFVVLLLAIVLFAGFKTNFFGLSQTAIQFTALSVTPDVSFISNAKELDNKEKIKIASNYITSDYLGLKKNNSNIKLPSSKNFTGLMNLVAENKISSRVAKDILAMIVLKDESPLKIATEKNLLQKNDEGALKEITRKIIDANSKAVADYKGGKENALMSLVGQIMKETKGSANPQMVKKLLVKMLK